jgi:Trk K+ transport system NAD-binding subunit
VCVKKTLTPTKLFLLMTAVAIIGGIVRDEIAHIATGDFQIQEGDHVIIFALPSVYKKIQGYFN